MIIGDDFLKKGVSCQSLKNNGCSGSASAKRIGEAGYQLEPFIYRAGKLWMHADGASYFGGAVFQAALSFSVLGSNLNPVRDFGKGAFFEVTRMGARGQDSWLNLIMYHFAQHRRDTMRPLPPSKVNVA